VLNGLDGLDHGDAENVAIGPVLPPLLHIRPQPAAARATLPTGGVAHVGDGASSVIGRVHHGDDQAHGAGIEGALDPDGVVPRHPGHGDAPRQLDGAKAVGERLEPDGAVFGVNRDPVKAHRCQ